MFFQFFVQLINTYYVGHYIEDPAVLAGVGMGNMLINVFCFAITQGLNSALETLVSQSFGYGRFKQCGVFLNRGRLISTVVLLPILVMLNFSDLALVTIGQDEGIAKISKEYSMLMIPGVWAMT